MTKSMAFKILLLLTLSLAGLTVSTGQASAGTKDINETLRKYYDGEWDILETKKSHNTTYNFYQRDTVYKAPGYIIYVWSFSEKDDEADFSFAIMGYASSSNFEYVHDIAKGIAPGMSAGDINRAFKKNSEWSALNSASTLLDYVKTIPGEKKNFYGDDGSIASVAVSFKNGKAYFVEYFNDGDRDDPPADWKNVFVNAIEDMKRYEWEKPFNEWVWKAKSGKMEKISGGGLSIKDTNGRKLPGAFGAVYRGAGTQDEAASVIFADIPDVKQAPLIDGGWLVLKNSASMPHPEYSVSISRENSKETVSFRKSLGDDEVWTIDCGRLNQPYREYRKGSAAIFRESTANGSLRFWLVDIEP